MLSISKICTCFSFPETIYDLFPHRRPWAGSRRGCLWANWSYNGNGRLSRRNYWIFLRFCSTRLLTILKSSVFKPHFCGSIMIFNVGEIHTKNIFSLLWPHGTQKSSEIQKKMPWFGTHIFWLGIPQGSQKYPNENITCVSKRYISIFSDLQGRP